MLPRERIEHLVDPDTPFLELSALSGWGTEFPIGTGTTVGIGIVEGVECAISATDMTYRGGSMNPRSVDKGSRFQEIVRENRLPWIRLTESAGPICHTKQTSSSEAGKGSATKPRCRSSAFRPSPGCSAPTQQAAPIRPV